MQKISKYSRANIKKDFKRNWILYAMVVPTIVFYIMFAYIPMVGNTMSFMEYVPGHGLSGFFTGKWKGLEYFVQFVTGNFFG